MVFVPVCSFPAAVEALDGGAVLHDRNNFGLMDVSVGLRADSLGSSLVCRKNLAKTSGAGKL